MKIYNFDETTCFGNANDDSYAFTWDHCTDPATEHMHEYYELTFTFRGEGVQIINGDAYPTKIGSIILFSKKDRHYFYSTNNLAMINFCFKDTKNLVRFPNNDSAIIVNLSNEHTREVKSILKVIETELQYKYSDYKEIISHNIDSIFTIMSRYSTLQVSTESMWSELLTYVFEHFDTVTLQDAMDITKMSKSYFCRKFKKDFSVSFLTYVYQLRIEQAKTLLISTNHTMNEIAMLIGYDTNVCRFHEDFKKFTNTTPHNYRIEHRAKSHVTNANTKQ